MESHGHPPIAPSNKKAKTKKAADPNETSKLLAAKISQLESDAAGEKDQEAEIGKWQNFFWIVDRTRRSCGVAVHESLLLLFTA